MKKGIRIKILRNIALAVFFVVSAYSCVEFDYEFDVENTDVAFEFVYFTEDGFKRNQSENYIGEEVRERVANWHKLVWNESYNVYSVYVDARTKEGYSTWSNPEFEFKFDNDLTPVTEEAHTHYYNGTVSLSSPPAHLHLCLESWDEHPVNKVPGKTWKIGSITDNNGQSLADDPDWKYYTDNMMRFQKTSSFVYTPGQNRSEIELDLFGTVQQHPTLKGTYSVAEDQSKKVTLTVSFPSFTENFEVVASGWNSLILKGTVKGKTGIMTLAPFKDANND